MLKSGTGREKKFCPVPAVQCFLVEVVCLKIQDIVPSRLSRVFSLKTRDSPVPAVCLQIRDIGLSRVFNEKTRDSRDGTIQCPIPVVCLKIRDIGLSRPG